MPQFISPPPMILQQPMTGYTQWNTPMGVVPLVGYPSAYPHVVDMTRRSYAAEVLSPEVYQAMAYRPATQPQQSAPAKKTPAKRPAGGGQSQSTRSAGTPNAPGTPPMQLAPPHMNNKFNMSEPAHEVAAPAQPVQIIPPLAPARNPTQPPIASPVAATLDAIKDFVPADYVLGNSPAIAPRRGMPAQRAVSPIDAVLGATGEYVPADYILGNSPVIAPRQEMPAQRAVSPIDAVLGATGEYVPKDMLLGGDAAAQYRAGVNRVMNILGRRIATNTPAVELPPAIPSPVEAPADEPVVMPPSIAPAAIIPSVAPAMYHPIQLEATLGVPAPISNGSAPTQYPGVPEVIPEAEGVFGMPAMSAPVAQDAGYGPLAAGQDIPALVPAPESDGRYEGEVMRLRDALRNYKDLLQLF